MNAIILAAGMGTRLRPFTKTTPKSLTVIKDEPLIERQIRFLQEIGINNIVVVTGYLHEKFSYLKEKFHVSLIYNDKFDQYNNIYSMFLVKEFLPDAYVIDADNYISRNFFLKHPGSSMYFSVKRPFQNEWVIKTDGEKRVVDIVVTDEGNDFILSGVSFWSKEDGEYIAGKLEENMTKEENFKALYWDEIVKNNIRNLNVRLYELHPDDIFEIDTVEDLQRVKSMVEKIR